MVNDVLGEVSHVSLTIITAHRIVIACSTTFVDVDFDAYDLKQLFSTFLGNSSIGVVDYIHLLKYYFFKSYLAVGVVYTDDPFHFPLMVSCCLSGLLLPLHLCCYILLMDSCCLGGLLVPLQLCCSILVFWFHCNYVATFCLLNFCALVLIVSH